MSSYLKERIIIASSNQINTRVLSNYLSREGYEIISIEKGYKVFEVLQKEPVDIILIDTRLIDIDGFKLCSSIKKHEKYRIIPVLILVQITNIDERIRGYQAEADGLIFKPFNENEVLAIVEKFAKTKEFNDIFQGTMSSISTLAQHAQESIKNFDPMKFDLHSNAADLARAILRIRSDQWDKPAQLFIGFKESGKRSRCYLYEYVFGNLDEVSINFDIEKIFKLTAKTDVKILLYNKEDSPTEEIKSFIDEIQQFKIVPINFVGYINNDFYLFAFNYGRTVTKYDAEIINTLAIQCLFYKTISNQIQKLDEIGIYTVHALARASEVNDEDPKKHIFRIGEYSSFIAQRLGMDEKFCRKIKIQSALHDVGKIYIPATILKKASKLNDEEWEIIKMHTIYGAQIIGNNPYFSIAKNIALYHHEKWDGTGYPNGLKGEQIPLEARIVALADVYDTLRIKRPYRDGFDHKSAIKIIIEGDGKTFPSHFDPEVLKIFKENHSKFDEIYESMQD